MSSERPATDGADLRNKRAALSGSYRPLQLDRIFWGEPFVEAVSAEVLRRESLRPLLVVSPSFARATGSIASLQRELQDSSCAIFDRLRPHVPRSAVFDLLNAITEHRSDLIVTIGGGTPIDTVKIALACLAENIQSEAELDRIAITVAPDGTQCVPPIASPPIRQIVVPTTLSGAEFSDLGGCTNLTTQVKQLFAGPKIGADTVILDAAATTATNERLWLSTGIRALDHAIETYCSSAPIPYTDALALKAIEMLSESLRITKRESGNLQARLDSQLGVWLACAGLNRVPWGASHGIGHQLGAVAGVPHGFCSCVMLPHVLRFNEAVNADRQKAVATALGAAGKSAASAVARLVEDLGLPTSLFEVGVLRSQFDAIAVGAMQNMFVRQNPRRIESAAVIHAILEAAF